MSGAVHTKCPRCCSAWTDTSIPDVYMRYKCEICGMNARLHNCELGTYLLYMNLDGIHILWYNDHSAIGLASNGFEKLVEIPILPFDVAKTRLKKFFVFL
jgi:hypothetical protein